MKKTPLDSAKNHRADSKLDSAKKSAQESKTHANQKLDSAPESKPRASQKKVSVPNQSPKPTSASLIDSTSKNPLDSASKSNPLDSAKRSTQDSAQDSAPQPIIAIIGLGYVGLPLALAFGAHYRTIGFDIDGARIAQLKLGDDATLESSSQDFIDARFTSFSDDLCDIAGANVFIIAVPTPITADKKPDISYLLDACAMVGSVLKKGDIVVYESTTYPTCTRTECIPALESASGLVCDRDFFVGYSPERINPADKAHSLRNVKKVTSGSTKEAAQKIDALYRTIITAGTHLAPSIEVAEAAKALENAQRDINIAFINEAYILLDKLGIDIAEVLEAARTKWNFAPFYPGLVGGHCIGVDPYYLYHIAQRVGYHARIIASGRVINEKMPRYFAHKLLKMMASKDIEILGAKVLVVGFAFKADCADIRNTKVPALCEELKSFGARVEVVDSLVDRAAARENYGIDILRARDLCGWDLCEGDLRGDDLCGGDLQKDLQARDSRGADSDILDSRALDSRAGDLRANSHATDSSTPHSYVGYYDAVLVVLRHKIDESVDFKRFVKENGVFLAINP